MEFKKIIQEIETFLENTKYCILSTSSKEGIVSSKHALIINQGLTLFLQADINCEQIKNIKENSSVGISSGDYTFKGKAEILGSVLDNTEYAVMLRRKYLSNYGHYSGMTEEELIKITLTECKIWAENDTSLFSGEPLTVVDIENKRVIKNQ